MPLARVVTLDAVGFVLADVEPALRDQLGVGRPIIGAVEARAPTLQALDQLGAGSSVTTAQLPVDEPPRRTIASLPDPELVGLFLRKYHISSSSMTMIGSADHPFPQGRQPEAAEAPALAARAFGRKPWQTAQARPAPQASIP